MRHVYIFIGLLISACGQNDSAQPAKDTAAEQQIQTQGEDPDAKGEGVEHALLVADAASLPACDDAREGQLVYVKSDKAFQVCAAGEWEAIDLRGDKGADGKDGNNGEDGIDSSSTVWLDPITKRRWISGAAANWAAAQSVCSGAYEYPSCDDLIDAANHGLYNGLTVHADAWCGSETSATWAESAPVDANPALDAHIKTDTIGVYCVEISE